MAAAQFLKTRVPLETKVLVQSLAEQQFITESTWLKRLVMEALRHIRDADSSGGGDGHSGAAPRHPRVLDAEEAGCAQASRVCFRLRPDDRVLLRERAAARGLPSATYVSVLLRAHLRNLAPLPKDELNVLKRSVTELGAIGRNLNQIARARNIGERTQVPAKDDVRTMLRVCEALRDNVKRLIQANLKSWDTGHAEREG